MIMSERVTGGASGKTTGSTFRIEPTAWAPLFEVPRRFLLPRNLKSGGRMMKMLSLAEELREIPIQEEES